MRIVYDEQLTIEEADEGYYFFYSPSLGKWFKGDEKARILIEEIIGSDGALEVEKVKSILKSKYNISESGDSIRNWIELLLQTKLFFISEEDFEAALSEFKKNYEIPKDQKLKTVLLHPTHRCNFNCTYCYNRGISKEKSEELSTQQWIDIVDKLKKVGVKTFVFTGGEPLLREDLHDIMSEIKKEGNGYFIDILTNGSMLTKERIEELLPLADRFLISIDSTDVAIQGETRSEAGFDILIQAIKLLAEIAPEKIHTRSVLTQQNVDDTIRTVKILKNQYSIPHHETALRLPKDQEEITLIPDLADVERIEKEIMTLEHREVILPGTMRCGASTSIIAVDAKGDIYPCQSFIEERELKLGSMLEDDWYEQVLSSPIRETFRTLTVDDREGHKDCIYRYLCGGGCLALAWKLYGRLDAYLPFLCEYNRMFVRKIMLLHELKEI